MKKIIFILLIPVITYGQNFEGAWGLKWGVSLDSAINIIKQEKGISPEIKKTDTTTTLIYMKAKWGIEASLFTRLEFYKNKLYTIYAFFVPDEGYKFMTTYKYLKSSISDKYSLPQKDMEMYKEPYTKEDPDNKKIYAILNGFGIAVCIWNFSITPNSEETGNIILMIDKNAGVILQYRDGDISKMVMEKNNQKNRKDF